MSDGCWVKAYQQENNATHASSVHMYQNSDMTSTCKLSAKNCKFSRFLFFLYYSRKRLDSKKTRPNIEVWQKAL